MPYPASRIGLALALVAILPCRALAADSTATSLADTTRPVKFLEQVVVTGSRYPRAYYASPQAISFLTRAQLGDQMPAVPGDALVRLPGVDNIKDSPWEQRPVIRGMTGQRVLVLMDGSPMNTARGNGPHPSLVDPEQIQRIEVVRGPSSVAYGSDALGGAINIITREAPPTSGNRMAGAAQIGGSTVDQGRNAYLELLPYVGKFRGFISAGGRKAEDFKTPAGTVDQSGFSTYNALANLGYDFTQSTALKLGWQLYRGSDIGIPGLAFAMPGYSQAFQFPYYDRDAVHLTVEHNATGRIENLRLRTYWQREARNFFSSQVADSSTWGIFGIPPGPPGATSTTIKSDRYFDLNTYGVQAQAQLAKVGPAKVATGLDFASDRTDGNYVTHSTYFDAGGNPSAPTGVRESSPVPTGHFDNYAGFLQGDVTVTPQWTVSLGGRYTHYRYRTDAGLSQPAAGPQPPVYFAASSRDDDALAGSAGIVYAPMKDLHLSANIANGYREPNAQDLYFNGYASVGLVLGNPDLKPEKSVSTDVGLRWGPGNFGLSLNGFYSTYRDLIDAIPVPPTGPGPPTYQYTNISTARVYGGEVEGEWRFLPDWNARGAASMTVGDITSASAIEQLYGIQAGVVPLANVPPFRITFGTRWTEPRGRLWVEPALRASWRTNRLPPAQPGVPEAFRKEWFVGDVSAGYRFGTGQKVEVAVTNIGDVQYRQPLANVDDPGRSLVGKVSTTF